jgi:hypothetical protein
VVKGGVYAYGSYPDIGRDVGDIGNPQPIRRFCAEVALD